MVEAEYPLRGLVGIARIADAVKDRAEPFKLGYIVLLAHKAQAQALHRVARFEQGLDLVLPHRTAVIAHDGDKRLKAALSPVIADEHALPRTYLDKAELLQLHKSRGDDRPADAHFHRQFPRWGQLLADGKLPGEYHIFYLLHEQISHGHCHYFIKAHSRLQSIECLWSFQIPHLGFYLQDA